MMMTSHIFSGVRACWSRQPAAPRIALRVTDERGAVLAGTDDAQRDDYRLRVELDSGAVIVDLYPHYLAFIENGASGEYRASDFACHTYVKFGHCIQDKCALHILIQAATQGETK